VDYEQLILSFTSIIYEALPFIVLGVLIAGLLEEFVPQQAISRIVDNTKILITIFFILLGVFCIGGLAAPTLVPYVDPASEFGFVIRKVFWLAALALLGVLAVALVMELLRKFVSPSFFSGKLILAIGVGSLLGLVFPMCECGIIVVMKRLLRKGLPLSVCVAYMLAGPVINVVVMTSTYVAFDPPQERDYVLGGPAYVVAWRVGLSYLIAITTALIVDWQWNKHGTRLLHPSVTRGLRHPDEVAAEDAEIAEKTWKERLNNITQTALHDFVDIMAFLVLGAILAAGGKFAMRQGNFDRFVQDSPAVAILIMMAIAVLFCLCSEADAFVAANFPMFWPPASKLAFLVLGPMLDLKLYLMYTRVFRTRLIFTIITSVVSQVFAYTMLIHYYPVVKAYVFP
jgi:uncharacterized membrane protein YraQ (UPF0718 family)